MKGEVCREVGYGSTEEARNVVSRSDVCVMSFVLALLSDPHFITNSCAELLKCQFVAIMDRNRDKVLAQSYVYEYSDANFLASSETSIW